MSNKDMRSVIKGVVVDHRIPRHINYIMNEPLYNKKRIMYVYNWIKQKHITHPNLIFPVSLATTFSVYVLFGLAYKKYYTGNFIFIQIVHYKY